MINLFKKLKKRDWCLILITITLIVIQVWLELKMPDYTAKLTTIVQGGSTKMRDVWKNGGLMLQLYVRY